MTLSLPANPAPDFGNVSQTTPRRKPTLLVVDDEDGPRQSLWVIFKDDYNVLLAENGMRAIELAQKNPIDVAVQEIRMQEMSGLEVLERLRFVESVIEAVIITAFETSQTMRQALQLRACDYINKPFDITTIRTAVANAMDRRSLTTEIRNNNEQLLELQDELHRIRIDNRLATSREEIYAAVVHDITGPLTIISGLIQLITQRMDGAKKLEGEDLEATKDRLKRITRQVTSCIEISIRYLSFLRKGAPSISRVWTNQILSDIGELLRVHPSTKNNQLLIHPLSEDVCTLIHGTDLIQILSNLILNGLQCTPNYHRVEVTGHLLREPLNLSLFQDGPGERFINRTGFRNDAPLLALSVQDNGPGIPLEILHPM